ncbi:DEAD/DEAH box helicase [Rhizobium sp. CNPSo 3464]|uniref:DEAD/DEAH box helicase n=1 Tax=Rhizobium sp. CNPSo 3464 TaxID=3021406 RepID=UPI0013AF73AD|nr:DEAD/DEAH box helicase [Rhizobium sp. CNPSo 3464]MDK4742630.1 DEAD/DEAH box helicase [Rhizobium sp. CNPSo 3464]
MKPDAVARQVLSTVRATAKMHEFRVAVEDFIELRRDPASLYSLAVGILGDAAGAVADHFVEPGTSARPPTWAEDTSIDENVRFAATFFDSYLEARLDGSISAEFSLLCAAAYYLSDAIGNAVVIVKRSDEPPADLGGGLALLASRILQNRLDPIDAEIFHSTFANRLLELVRAHYALQDEDERAIPELCGELREMLYEIGTDREVLYADIVTAICAGKIQNSSRNKLPPASGLPLTAWSPALTKPGFPIELWPAQRRICDADLLNGRSAVIQMPTSAGKTRATELIIRAAFLSGRTSLAIIVAPFKSLCHDIRSDLVRAFQGENILMDEVSDSYLMDFGIEQLLAQNSVLVITPEKLLYMLRRAPDLAERIGLIVYDEGHQFEGFTRGPTYELLLSSLRMMLKPAAQIVLISAVIGNAEQIADWLIGDASAIVGGKGLLPTAKSIAFASWQKERGWLRYVNPLDPDEDEYFVPRIIEELPLEKKSKRERDRVFPDRNHPAEISESVDIGLYLALHLGSNGSVALFCGQKASVSKVSWRVVDLFTRKVELEKPSAWSDQQELDRLANLIASNLGNDADVVGASRLGVLSHHASTPHGIRLCVEHAMKAGHARIVACTSTLAQGVNFPIKYLVVTATQQGKEKIKVRDFHNLMGRAGRAGMHTESSVIFSAPPIYDERGDDYKNWRWEAAKKLLDQDGAEPSQSSILQIFDDYKQTAGTPIVLTFDLADENLAFADEAAIELIVAEVLKQFPNVSASELRDYLHGRARAIQSIAMYLAQHIDFEAEDAIDAAERLAANTLGYHLADETTRPRVIALFQATVKSIQSNTDAAYRLLIKKSPLPPAALRKLSAWVEASTEQLTAAVKEGTLLPLLIEQALPLASAKSLSALSDAAVIPTILSAWTDGKSFAEIRQILVNDDIRVSGDHATADHIVAICEDGFGYHVAMILASVVDLLETIEPELVDATTLIQRQVKNGLQTESALAFYEAGFADRVIAQLLAEAFPTVNDRYGAKVACRDNIGMVAALLESSPEYFRGVAHELASM